MVTIEEIRTQYQQFGQRYDYDASYLVALAEQSIGAFEAFTAAQGMSHYRQALPLEAHFVARITAMQEDDCGPCLNLNLKMALEVGVDRDLLQTLIDRPEQLPEPLRDVREHTRAAIRNQGDDAERMERICERYGREAFAELAVVITGCRIYPTLKRALGMADYCELARVEL